MSLSRRSYVRGVGAFAGVGSLGAITYETVSGQDKSTQPQALVAGSLLRLAEKIPGATVEAHGSAAVRRLILNDMRSPDAVALADPRLFDGISNRTTLFATNALVLTYSPDSAYVADIQQDWTEAVAQEGIRLGRTDPTLDPLGYRTVMALRLAEAEYDLNAQRVLNNTRIFPETDMLNIVEGNTVDAAFLYRNMAVQRDLPYVSLPDTINFSNPDYADVYRTASYDLAETTIHGAPIRYGATTLTDAAEPWIDNLVTARELLRKTGFTVPADYPRRNERLTFRTSRAE